MSVGEYAGQARSRVSSRVSLGGIGRDITAEKVATAFRKGATISEVCDRFGIGPKMVRSLSAEYDFSIPSTKGERNWPAKDEPGIKEDTTYAWARRNWERAVNAARSVASSEAYCRSWDMPPAVFYDEYIAAPPKATSAAEVIRQVCKKHQISKDALIGPLRRKEIMAARHEAAFRMVVEVGMSYPQTGRMLGGRDHTTILNSVRRHASSSPLAMAAYREFQTTAETSSEALAEMLIYDHFECGVSVNQLCKRHSVSRIRVMQFLLEEADRRRGLAA